MTLKNETVVRSINNDESNLCVDLFKRNNETFGYEEYRKDPESTSGWYRIGNYSNKIFLSINEAYQDALKKIIWLQNKR